MVAGIERNGQRIMNPDGNTLFRSRDVLWLVGNGNAIKHYMEEHKALRE
jgi:CPA2 family monovalent cation:H+ antiporter-2